MYKRPDHITDEIIYVFGNIIYISANIDVRINHFIKEMLGTDLGKSIVLTWHMSFSEKLDRIGGLADAHEIQGQARIQLDSLISRMREANTTRNIIAHCIWKKGEREGEIFPIQISTKKKFQLTGFNQKVRTFTLASLQADQRMMERLLDDLVDYIENKLPLLLKKK